MTQKLACIWKYSLNLQYPLTVWLPLRFSQEVSLLNPDFPHVEANPGDLSPGDDPWDLEGHRTHAGIVLLPRLDLPPTSHQDPPQSHRRSQEKR